MKYLVMSLLSLVSVSQSYAQSPHEQVLVCFSHEEMGPSHFFRVFKTESIHSPEFDSYFMEYFRNGGVVEYGIREFDLTARDLYVEIGPGPEAGGLERDYYNGEIRSVRPSPGQSFSFLSRFTITDVFRNLEVTCRRPLAQDAAQPLTR